MSGKSFLTRSAKERAKLQKKSMVRLDKKLNKKVKQLKKSIKKKLEKIIGKIAAVAAVFAAGGLVIFKWKEIAQLKNNEKIMQLMTKLTKKQEEE